MYENAQKSIVILKHCLDCLSFHYCSQLWFGLVSCGTFWWPLGQPQTLPNRKHGSKLQEPFHPTIPLHTFRWTATFKLPSAPLPQVFWVFTAHDFTTASHPLLLSPVFRNLSVFDLIALGLTSSFKNNSTITTSLSAMSSSPSNNGERLMFYDAPGLVGGYETDEESSGEVTLIDSPTYNYDDITATATSSMLQGSNISVDRYEADGYEADDESNRGVRPVNSPRYNYDGALPTITSRPRSRYQASVEDISEELAARLGRLEVVESDWGVMAVQSSRNNYAEARATTTSRPRSRCQASVEDISEEMAARLDQLEVGDFVEGYCRSFSPDSNTRTNEGDFIPAPSNFGTASLLGFPLDIPSNHPAILQLHAWHAHGVSLGLTNDLPCRRGHAPSGEKRYRPENALILSELRVQLMVAIRSGSLEALLTLQSALDATTDSGLLVGHGGKKRKRGAHQCSRNCRLHAYMVRPTPAPPRRRRH
ncbi:hypothetical protein BZA05DRAFT_254052 [Tricharina praecox]|uniref:uncharacterized protein n=1 Tax=Tricharina praecox TaxID=43433 RepID=UPI00221EAC87|nr:uncharacterized protein BZA05DRAFT_254052 [Tricharina praecox]KAI5854947.1 hypothetical protein BZA05DRAFT_254052 [Tricharina praecox]